ncbi:MAG TPA: phage tail tape measure protein [Planctomycetota bacterium]|nr:phage tail tape measure protein [Planctomycetota bacterium]
MMNELGMGVVVSMKDMFTQNAYRIQSSMMSLDGTVAAASASMQRNLGLVQRGAMTMGAGLALLAVPAIVLRSTVATQKALGEMASVGVKDLDSLAAAAEEFSNAWGGTSKAEFIAAAYDIKSGIASLSDAAVGEYAKLAALTAKATKATVAEMTSLFATGYGIYRDMYAKMSDFEFGELFSGGLAAAVQVYKTTGPGMAAAISTLGASATMAKIPLEEQLAVLGLLQATMSGAEAGTKYHAFLKSAAEAGKELNLSFVDQNNNLLSVVGIIGKLRERYGETLDAMEKLEIQKAFGRIEAVAVVDMFYNKVGDVTKGIKEMSAAMRQGTQYTIGMAQAMNMDIGSQMAIVGQQMHNLLEILGQLLLPVVNPIIRGISAVVLALQRMAKAAPGLTRVVLVLGGALGLVLTVVGAVIAAAGTIGLLLPAVKAGFLAMGAAASTVGGVLAAKFLPITLIIIGVIAAVKLLRRAWEANFGGIRDFVVGAYEKVKAVFQGIGELARSLVGGTGRISAELADKLKAMGLWGFVKTVFMVYYRVRQFMVGLWTAVSSAFRKIAAILGPPIRALMSALGALARAFLSILQALGLVSTAADGSAFQSLGQVLGTLLGIIAQVAAYVLKFILYPLSWVLHIVAALVRAVVWLVSTIVQGAIYAVKFLYKFFLPLRLIANAIGAVVKIVYTLWQVLTGDISVVEGLKKIGGTIVGFLLTPFRWVKDAVVGLWNLIKSVFEGTAAFFKAGKAIILAFGRGIWSVITYPFRLVWKVLKWIRDLLPFSDAKAGPLSDLTAAGAALIKTLCKGILGVILLPFQIIAALFRGLLAIAGAIWSGIKAVVAAGWRLVKGIAGFAVDILAAPFRLALSVGKAIWSGVKSIVSAGWEAIKSVGSAVWSVVSAPFEWIGSAASSAWQGIKSAASSAWEGMTSMAASAAQVMSDAFSGIANAAASAWDWIKEKAAGAWEGIKSMASGAWEGIKSVASSAYEAGKSVLTTVAEGAASVITAPYKVAKKAFNFLRSLLPFSDAEEGPLSNLSASGRSILETMARGMQQVAGLPAKVFSRIWGFLTGPARVAQVEPTALTGWLGGLARVLAGLVSTVASALPLASAVAAPMTSVAAAAEKPVPVVIREREVHQARLLAERGAPLAPVAGAPTIGEQSFPMKAFLTRLDELADRPIDVNITVVSKLDGRAVAQAVYRNIRQEKVKNYETL